MSTGRKQAVNEFEGFLDAFTGNNWILARPWPSRYVTVEEHDRLGQRSTTLKSLTSYLGTKPKGDLE